MGLRLYRHIYIGDAYTYLIYGIGCRSVIFSGIPLYCRMDSLCFIYIPLRTLNTLASLTIDVYNMEQPALGFAVYYIIYHFLSADFLGFC